MSSDFFLSIITVAFNAEQTIERTLKSVVAQRDETIQFIVIDGQSTDSTFEIAQRYSDNIDILFSEKDAGIGDAWNKGLKLAKGRLILLLNADDELASDTIAKLKTLNERADDGTLYYGTTDFIDGDDKEIGVNAKLFDPARLASGFGFMFTSCVIPRQVFERIGPFNPGVRIAVDTEWLLRAHHQGIPFERGTHRIRMRIGGVSHKYKRRAFAEYHEALKGYGFTSQQLRKARLRHGLAVTLGGLKEEHPGVFTQLSFLYVRATNLLFNLLPAHWLRRRLSSLFRVSMGSGATIHPPVRFFGLGQVTVGADSVVNRNCYLDNRADIFIGNNVSVAHDAKIYTGGHDINSPSFNFTKRAVRIDDHAVIFAGAMIQPGVHVAQGAVILPGSVVVADVPEFVVYGGNPARKVADRQRELTYNCKFEYWFAP